MSKKIPLHSKDACPIHRITQVLSDAWTVLLIRDLLIAPKRFCESERSLEGISTRTLTLKLEKLLEEKIVTHTDLYYSLTPKGALFKPIIDEMSKAGKKIG